MAKVKRESIELKKRGKKTWYDAAWVSPSGNVWARKVTIVKGKKKSDLADMS